MTYSSLDPIDFNMLNTVCPWNLSTCKVVTCGLTTVLGYPLSQGTYRRNYGPSWRMVELFVNLRQGIDHRRNGTINLQEVKLLIGHVPVI